MAKSAIKEIAKLSMENLVGFQTPFPRSTLLIAAVCILGAAGVVRGA
jgi:hypothetical protein